MTEEIQFRTEYAAKWWDDDKFELMKLAESYHQRCDEYDRSVCHFHGSNGEGWPCTSEEWAKVYAHAREVEKEYVEAAAMLGFSPKQWHEERGKAAKRRRVI